MDCFFVSVGLLSRPHLREKPIAVTHHQANTPSINLRRPGVDEEYERNFYKKKNVLFGDSSVTKQPNPRLVGVEFFSKKPFFHESPFCPASLT